MNQLNIDKYYFHFVETTDSTNLLLNKIVEKEKKTDLTLPDFFCVATDFQTAGRGQGEKLWLSNKGENLLVSFFFLPSILPPQQIYFNYFFALTIRSVISFFINTTLGAQHAEPLKNYGVKIKKPNDIWVEDKKIAGILIEHHIQGEKLTYSIAGVGININQTQFDGTLLNPTSLKLITKKTFSREIILEKIVQTGKIYYNKLQNGAFKELKNEYELFLLCPQLQSGEEGTLFS
jgi:BirA family biotin operon repressor/biotin-[acetyl-CoA-carboxylase] ligase